MKSMNVTVEEYKQVYNPGGKSDALLGLNLRLAERLISRYAPPTWTPTHADATIMLANTLITRGAGVRSESQSLEGVGRVSYTYTDTAATQKIVQQLWGVPGPIDSART